MLLKTSIEQDNDWFNHNPENPQLFKIVFTSSIHSDLNISFLCNVYNNE